MSLPAMAATVKIEWYWNKLGEGGGGGIVSTSGGTDTNSGDSVTTSGILGHRHSNIRGYLKKSGCGGGGGVV